MKQLFTFMVRFLYGIAFAIFIQSTLIAQSPIPTDSVASTKTEKVGHGDLKIKRDKLKFNNEFFLHVDSDNKNHYFVVDRSKLPSEFEQNYFLDLIYKNPAIVSIGHNPDENLEWFLVNKLHDLERVIASFKENYNKTKTAERSLNKEQKAKWSSKKIKQ